MELKDQIRLAREAAGFTQAELANRLGLSKQSITWWEAGDHRPKSDRIRQIEDVLNVHLDLGERGNATPLDEDKKSLAVDPVMMRLASAIQRLPRAHRDAIIALTFMSESKQLGTNAHNYKNGVDLEAVLSKHEESPSDTIDILAAPVVSKEFDFVEKRNVEKVDDGSTTEVSKARKRPAVARVGRKAS